MNQISIFRAAVFVMVAGLRILMVSGRSLTNETQLLNKNCALFYFFDHGTDSCEQCRGMCEHHERLKTTEACFKDCPDYMTAQQCKADEYYDEHIRACSSCRQLCHNIDTTSDTQPCGTFCTDYVQSNEEQGPKVITGHKPSQSTSSDTPDKNPEIHNAHNSQSQPALMWVIPFVSAAVVIAAMVVVVVVLIQRPRCNPQAVKYGPASTSDASMDGTDQTQADLKFPQPESRPGPAGRMVVSGT